jgi:peptidyl-prolyl cis-trans isomerase D
LLQSIFSADAIAKKQNTEAVEISTNQLVSARVISHKPVTKLQLEDVRPVIAQSVLSQKSLDAAKKEGEEKLGVWQKDPSLAKLQAPVLISREQNINLPPAVIEAAMRSDASKLPMLVGVDLGARGFGVVKINSVVKSLPLADRKDTVGKYAKAWTSAESIAYFDFLKSRLKVEYKVEKPQTGSLLKQP